MSQETFEKLRYPIGQFSHVGDVDTATRERWIGEIAALPDELAQAVSGLSDEQLNTPYRPGGWTARQVVHHIADSHINSMIRFKWTLTEDKPTIKAYHEDRWAELADYRDFPIEQMLMFIRLLHQRWVVLLKSLSDEDLQKTFIHPDSGKVDLATNLGIYAWHGKHHIAHINNLRDLMGW